MLVVLYFQAITALVNPLYREGQSIKWGLVGYLTVLFGLATTFTALKVRLQQLAYIDNREFPGLPYGVPHTIPPGPIGWSLLMYSKPLAIIPNVCFIIANWMADDLLVSITTYLRRPPQSVELTSHQMYRCYVIYNMKRWIIIFPLALYLASICEYASTKTPISAPQFLSLSRRRASSLSSLLPSPTQVWNGSTVDFGLPYFTISVSLNVPLTVMISIRLILHSRNIRGGMGARTGVSSLYRTIVTMLIESSALYAITSLLFIGPYVAHNYASDIFLPVLAQVQVGFFILPVGRSQSDPGRSKVIAPLLTIRRVATRNALTNTTITSGAPTSSGMTFRIGAAGQTAATGSTLQVDYLLNSMDGKYRNRIYGETTIDLPPTVWGLEH
jgi:hypothetical protein